MKAEMWIFLSLLLTGYCMQNGGGPRGPGTTMVEGKPFTGEQGSTQETVTSATETSSEQGSYIGSDRSATETPNEHGSTTSTDWGTVVAADGHGYTTDTDEPGARGPDEGEPTIESEEQSSELPTDLGSGPNTGGNGEIKILTLNYDLLGPDALTNENGRTIVMSRCFLNLNNTNVIFLSSRWLTEPPEPPPDNVNYELDGLVTQLFKTNRYNPLIRPSQFVTVQVALNLITLQELSIKDQSLSIAGYFNLNWDDGRLSWNENDTYKKISDIFTRDTYIWYPTVIVENSIMNFGAMRGNDDPVRISKSGIISWSPSGIFKTQCITDVTFYPFDRQTCEITISTQGYTGNEIQLRAAGRPVNLKFYRRNGEWDHVSFKVDNDDSDKAGSLFSELTFYLVFQRRPYFHIMNTIVPLVLLASLSTFVFKLPCESGEKMGYSLTVLVAFTVYLTLVASNIPTTSNRTSLLSLYVVLMLALGVLSVLSTVFVLNCHHAQVHDRPMPGWLKNWVMRCEVKGICHRIRYRRNRRSSSKVNDFPSELNMKKEEPIIASWQDVAKSLDKMFYRMFSTIMAAMTSIFILTMYVNYDYNYEEVPP